MLPLLTEFQIWGLAHFPSAITLRSYRYYFTMSVLNEKTTGNFTCIHSTQWFPTSSLPTDQTLLGGAPSTYLIWQTWHKESTVHLSQETLQFIRIQVHLTRSGVTWELRKLQCQRAGVWSRMSYWKSLLGPWRFLQWLAAFWQWESIYYATIHWWKVSLQRCTAIHPCMVLTNQNTARKLRIAKRTCTCLLHKD